MDIANITHDAVLTNTFREGQEEVKQWGATFGNAFETLAEYDMLFRYFCLWQPNIYHDLPLEFGAYYGHSDVIIVKALIMRERLGLGHKSNLIAVDPCERLCQVGGIIDYSCTTFANWNNMLVTHKVWDRVLPIPTTTVEAYEGILHHLCGEFRVIFIDGGHFQPDVGNDINMAFSLLNDNGVMLLHDYRDAWDVKPAVDNLITNSAAKHIETVDTMIAISPSIGVLAQKARE